MSGQEISYVSSMMCGPPNNPKGSTPLSQIAINREVSGFSPRNSLIPEEISPRADGGSSSRKSSKASASQVQLQETYISVGSLDEEAERPKKDDVWKRKKRTLRIPDIENYMQSAPVKRVTHPLEESVAISVITGAFNIFLIIFVSIPITLVLGLLFPVFLIFKSFKNICSKNFYYTLLSRRADTLSPHDAQFLLNGNQPAMHSVLFIDGPIELKRVKQMLSSRVVHAKSGSGGYMYPRFTQLVAPKASGWVWSFDNKFNLNNHIFSGPELSSEKALQNYVSSLLFQPLKMSRPLWEVIVMKWHGKHRETILICRIHHCIADGMSLMRILCQSLSDNQIVHIPQKPHFGGTTYGLNLFRSFMVGPLSILTWMYWWKPSKNILSHHRSKPIMKNKVSLASTPSCGTSINYYGGCDDKYKLSIRNSFSIESGEYLKRSVSINEVGAYTVMGPEEKSGFVVLWSSKIPLSRIIRIKQVTRTCLNDILLSSLSGAIRNSLQKLGVVNPSNLKVNLAVDLRDNSIPFSIPELGTKASFVAVELPVEIEGSIPRVWKIRDKLQDMKASADAVVSYCLVWWAYKCLPSGWCSALLRDLHGKSSLHYSSLPGPSTALILGGFGVKKILNISPPHDPLNLSITVLTYLDKVQVSVCARQTIPHAKWIAKNIITEMEKQCEQMSEILSHRRLPGEQKKSFFLNHGSEIHSIRPLSELQFSLAKVQSELQKVTEQYELEFRRGLCSKSKSSDFDKFQRHTVVGYESEVTRGGSPVVKTTSADNSLRRNREDQGSALHHRASTSNLTYRPTSQELACKVQTLKQEFTDLLAEIRRRKSISEKGTSSVTPQDEEESSELRKARKRTLSLVSVRSVTSVTSSCSTQSRDFSSKDPLFSPTSSARPLIAPSVPPLGGCSPPQSKLI